MKLQVECVSGGIARLLREGLALFDQHEPQLLFYPCLPQHREQLLCDGANNEADLTLAHIVSGWRFHESIAHPGVERFPYTVLAGSLDQLVDDIFHDDGLKREVGRGSLFDHRTAPQGGQSFQQCISGCRGDHICPQFTQRERFTLNGQPVENLLFPGR